MDFGSKLGKEIVFTTELGGINGTELEVSVEKAKAYAGVDAINIHDCPNAHLRMNSIMAGSIIQKELGIPVIPHLTCRDRSLLGTQADLLGAHALGIRYLLPTTGDGPQHGPYKSSGVYDYNTLGFIKMIKCFNQGLDINGKEFKGKTEFGVSATATPGADNLDSVINRMENKIEAGATFFQTQPVYEVDKARNFLIRARALGTPVLLGLMPLKSLKMAEFVNKNMAGVHVPDNIISELERGRTGFEIACEFIQEIYEEIDGLHIFGMGDVDTTNKLIEFTSKLAKEAKPSRNTAS